MTDLLEQSRRYVLDNCIAAEDLAAVAGVSLATLEPVLPKPTYRLYPAGVSSSVELSIGTCDGPARAYYGRAVPWWLRRAAEFRRDAGGVDLAAAMKAWLADDLRAVLRERAPDASRFAWGHLVDAAGTIDETAFAAAIDELFADWIGGGWAVCLREFDAHHLVTKESERARITFLTQDGRRERLDTVTRHQLLNAIARLDSVMTPFAPYERPTCTPGKFIDAVIARYCTATIAA